jgi:hypothetical protein
MPNSDIIRLIQSHEAIVPFDYNLVVEWAFSLIQEGKETDNILILASFSGAIEKYEIAPYVTAVLNELGLKEIEYEEQFIAQTHFLLFKILKNESIHEHLQSLNQICIDNSYDDRLINFYLLYHGWKELEDLGVNYYYDDANLTNIESILKLEAKIWIDKNIYNKENTQLQQKLRNLIDNN